MNTERLLRHHTTWYSYDAEGRVDKLWTALSPEGDQYGIGVNFLTLANPPAIVTTKTWNTKPAQPDVQYTYDNMDRLVSKVYPDVDGLGTGFTTTWTINQRGQLTNHAVTKTFGAVNIRTDGFTRSADGRITNKTTTPAVPAADWDFVYDFDGRLIETDDQTDFDYYYPDEVDSRFQHSHLGTMLTDYGRTGGPAGNNSLLLVDETFTVPAPTDVAMTYNTSGQMAQRVITPSATPLTPTTESYTYGYHNQVVGMRIEYPELPEPCPIPLPPGNIAGTFDPDQEVWTYRYGPNGVREQRRLQQSPKHDSLACSGVMPWTYYINDVSGNVLAVYHGRQINRPGWFTCDPPEPEIDPETMEPLPLAVDHMQRRVFMYPTEFRAYGPDGVNVIFERDNNGNMVNAIRSTGDACVAPQGSVVLVQDAADAHYAYTPFGEPLACRGVACSAYPFTGYLDRETDWESSPDDLTLRTLNLVHRTYVPKHGTFTTPDPLWSRSIGSSAYHYANHDPVNMSDPWGVDGVPSDGVMDGGGSGEVVVDAGLLAWDP